jgi:hypothetical protein
MLNLVSIKTQVSLGCYLQYFFPSLVDQNPAIA